MYIIGAVSKAELSAIKKFGYDVEKVIKPKEFNKLFGKKGEGIVEPDAEDLAIVYVDCDLVEQLQQWSEEERGRLQAKIAKELRDLQLVAAQKAFEADDLDGIACTESDGWENDGSEYWVKKFYFDNRLENEESTESGVATYVVIFKKGTDVIEDSHVNIW